MTTARGMRFSELLALAAGSSAAALGPAATSPLLGGSPVDPLVSLVAHDHRAVEPGALFVARRGERFDAHDHLVEAVAAGAVAVAGEVAPSALPLGLGVPYVQVASGRRALAHLAAALYRFPSRSLRVVGVTGTDGKTTASFMLNHLLGVDRPVGLISTAAVRTGAAEVVLSGHFTTPEANDVQRLLAAIRDAGAAHAVLESSSHGFALHRLDAVDYAVGVVTNVSEEHLDMHGSLQAYAEAKATLVRRASVAVLNRDDPLYDFFAAAAEGVAVTYGEREGAHMRLLAVTQEAGGLRLELSARGHRQSAELPMVGRYNAHNAAAALTAAMQEGVDLDVAVARLASFPGVPGRMQLIAPDPTVIVDFAHTPPALAKALAAVKPAAGRLIVVVGSAGERDPGKRRPLGGAAVEGSDLAIFTEEDSRSEDVEVILAEMAAGARAVGGVEGEDFVLQPDRSQAIKQAVAAARRGDVVLLAGKGHERTLERAGETLAWDEAAEALRAVEG